MQTLPGKSYILCFASETSCINLDETCLFSSLERYHFPQVRAITSTIKTDNQEKSDFFDIFSVF